MDSKITGDGWLLLFPPLFWAINSVVGRALAGQFPPLALSLCRWSLAFLFLLPFALPTVRRHWPLLREHWRGIVALAVLGVGLYNSLLYTALLTSTPVNVLLIGATAPSFVLVAQAWLDRAAPNGRAIMAAALSIVGVGVVASRGELAHLQRLTVARGDVVMMAATLVWVTYTLILRRARPPVPTLALLQAQIGIGLIVLLPSFLVEWLVFHPPMTVDVAVLAALLFVAIFPSILAYVCWDRGVRAAGAETAVILANLAPVIAAILAWIFLGRADWPVPPDRRGTDLHLDPARDQTSHGLSLLHKRAAFCGKLRRSAISCYHCHTSCGRSARGVTLERWAWPAIGWKRS